MTLRQTVEIYSICVLDRDIYSSFSTEIGKFCKSRDISWILTSDLVKSRLLNISPYLMNQIHGWITNIKTSFNRYKQITLKYSINNIFRKIQHFLAFT